MSVDYVVASLQPLSFDGPAPYTLEQFLEQTGPIELPPRWTDLETQLRNAIAAARGGEKWRRPAAGCDLHWQNRIAAAFAEKDPLKRETLVDRVFWDAAGELTPVASPLSAGALQTYYLRLKIALKRNRASAEAGNAAFDRLTAATKQVL